ncbi:hypothetical protein DSO57_1032105, partial [Entomophthora muscae]
MSSWMSSPGAKNNNCHLELANIQAMVKSNFGVEASISFYYHLVKRICFSWKKLG